MGFSKRLGTLCLQLLHNGAIAGLALLRQLLVTHTAVEQLLDSEHEVRIRSLLPLLQCTVIAVIDSLV